MTTRKPIRERLLEYYTEDEAAQFMRTEQPLLSGRVPNDLLREGREDEIHLIFDRLDSGTFI